MKPYCFHRFIDLCLICCNFENSHLFWRLTFNGLLFPPLSCFLNSNPTEHFLFSSLNLSGKPKQTFPFPSKLDFLSLHFSLFFLILNRQCLNSPQIPDPDPSISNLRSFFIFFPQKDKHIRCLSFVQSLLIPVFIQPQTSRNKSSEKKGKR